jgi:hypothetical protein
VFVGVTQIQAMPPRGHTTEDLTVPLIGLSPTLQAEPAPGAGVPIAPPGPSSSVAAASTTAAESSSHPWDGAAHDTSYDSTSCLFMLPQAVLCLLGALLAVWVVVWGATRPCYHDCLMPSLHACMLLQLSLCMMQHVCVHAAAAFSLHDAASHDALPADVAEDKVCSGCMMYGPYVPAPVRYVVGFLGRKAGHSVKKVDFVNPSRP